MTAAARRSRASPRTRAACSGSACRPGDYTLEPQPVEGLMGTAQPMPFTVADGAVTWLDVAYDTGIR